MVRIGTLIPIAKGGKAGVACWVCSENYLWSLTFHSVEDPKLSAGKNRLACDKRKFAALKMSAVSHPKLWDAVKTIQTATTEDLCQYKHVF
jgi:hypothetical protein